MDLKGKRILLVDDDEYSIKAVRTRLRDRGATVEYAARLEEAYQLVIASDQGKEEPFDLVVIDLRFNNGFPPSLADYIPDRNAIITYGLGLGRWIEQWTPTNGREKPLHLYRTAFPDRTERPEITLDKLDVSAGETVTEIARRLTTV